MLIQSGGVVTWSFVLTRIVGKFDGELNLAVWVESRMFTIVSSALVVWATVFSVYVPQLLIYSCCWSSHEFTWSSHDHLVSHDRHMIITWYHMITTWYWQSIVHHLGNTVSNILHKQTQVVSCMLHWFAKLLSSHQQCLTVHHLAKDVAKIHPKPQYHFIQDCFNSIA